MQAIILAAGLGRRLGDLTIDNTKCMIEINGETLIKRMLRQLERYSLKQIIIVVGYKAQNLIDHVQDLEVRTPVVFIENPIYATTNNIYSLYLAKEQLLDDDTIIIESDLIFETSILDNIVNNPSPSLVLVEKYESWMDGTVVTVDDDDRILQFIPPNKFSFDELSKYYKTLNIYKFSKDFSNTHYVPFLEAYIKALGENEFYEQVLRVIALLDKPEIKALRLENNEAWYEIDDIQDFDIAQSIFSNRESKLQKYQKRYGGYWRYPSLKDFCYLVNPYFPNSKLICEIKANFEELVRSYPSGMDVNTLLAAKKFGVKQDYIVVSNGATELIKSIMENLEGEIGIILPTFEEYPNRLDNGMIIEYLPDNPDFSYDASDLISYYDETDIKTLLIINPDNPSGNFIPKEQLVQLCDWSNKKKINLIIDESFVDFSDGFKQNTLVDNNILEKYNYLMVVKSISKSYGVPGLRLGVMVSSNKEMINEIRKDVPIWNINSFAEFYMQVFGKYEKDYWHGCELIHKERNRFYDELKKISFLRVIPSQANYFLCEVYSMSATDLCETLLSDYNVLAKDCTNKRGIPNDRFIRISVRNKQDNDYMLSVLKKIEANNKKEL